MMPAVHSGTLVVRRNPKLAWREIEGDIVIISPEDSRVHELNETAGLFWKYVDGRRDLDGIATSLAEMYDVPMDTIRADIEELVADLSAKNLLLVSAGGSTR
ncbi:MAG TPA: PqqD family protein [Candidatus Micrarchaeia archaeon]|nr:PqqD family protein [Candidatus Micrarchaeia archaeon]